MVGRPYYMVCLISIGMSAGHVIRRDDLVAQNRRKLTSGSASGCPCLQSFRRMQENASYTCVVQEGEKYMLPPEYGLGCGTHDQNIGPGCTGPNPPSWCLRRWCYVNWETCRKSDASFGKSLMFPRSDLYFSYEACGDSGTYGEVSTHWSAEFTRDATLVAALPTVTNFPVHFKRNLETGQPLSTVADADELDAYLHNDTIPWEGAIVDFLVAVLSGSTIQAIRFTYISKGTEKLYASRWTSLVAEVGRGNADIGASGTWMTAERLALGDFMTPLYNDDFYLFVPNPQVDDSFFSKGSKVFLPFTPTLWGLIGLVIVVAGLLNTYLTLDDWSEEIEARKTTVAVLARLQAMSAQQTGRQSAIDVFRCRKLWLTLRTARVRLQAACRVFARNFFRASYLSVMAAFGETTMLADTDQSSIKLMNVGYAFFLLITISAYTANLAAFMTQEVLTSSFGSIEQAISHVPPITLCAHSIVENSLRQAYPDARWHFAIIDTREQLERVYAAQGCGALVYSQHEFVGSLSKDLWRCDRSLVAVGTPVYSVPVGMAGSRPDVPRSLSHWMSHLSDTTGNTYLSYEDAVHAYNPSCPARLTVADDSELIPLDTLNFSFTIAIFVIFAVLALTAHCLRGGGQHSRGAMHEATRSGDKRPLLSEDEAAIMLQSAWRGRQSRKKMGSTSAVKLSVEGMPPSGAGTAKPRPMRKTKTLSALVELPPPEPQRALTLGIKPNVSLEFSVTGGLHTVLELGARSRTKLTSAYKVVGPAALFESLSPEQSTVLRTCNGRLSPLNKTNLSNEEKARAGIPIEAAYFCFAYPANRLLEVRTKLDLEVQPWGAALSMGGFWYFDQEKQLLQANSFDSVDNTAPQLHFAGPASVTESGACRALEAQGRMQRVTIESLLEQGIERFGWVHGSEKPGGCALSHEHGYPMGGFVYAMASGEAIFYALQKSPGTLETVRPSANAPARPNAANEPARPEAANAPARPDAANEPAGPARVEKAKSLGHARQRGRPAGASQPPSLIKL